MGVVSTGHDGAAKPSSFKSLDIELLDAAPVDCKVERDSPRSRRAGRRRFLCAVVLGASAAAAYIFVMSQWKGIAVHNMLGIDARAHSYAGLTMENLTRSIHWPGCGLEPWADNCTLPCYSKEVPLQVADFTGRFPGKLVSYPSRPHPDIDTVELRGWYLPARADRVPEGRRAPRVVLQHGFRENSNYWRYVLLAYMLRQCGIDVLANNFRDHGYSDRSPGGRSEWGNAYPYDLLGAWDFARAGAGGDAQVGLVGLSKGGFTALNAMGLEPRVPAAWVDGSMFSPELAWEYTATRFLQRRRVPQWLARWLVGRGSSDINAAAARHGMDLSRHTPETSLPQGPDTRRPLYVTHNREDALSPVEWNTHLMDVLQSIPEKYAVQEGGPWLTDKKCHGNPHCTTHLSEFGEYLGRLCRFWRATFEMGTTECESVVEEATRRLPSPQAAAGV